MTRRCRQQSPQTSPHGAHHAADDRLHCEGAWCAATLDEGNAAPGLLIVSGGNEIRSGAHAGQAAMAAHFAGLGYPVFRYDRRGIGDSEGENGGFEASAADISAAVAAFRAEAPHVTRIVAFGNCDAATSLAFFHAGLGIDRLLLANPWVIEASPDGRRTNAPQCRRSACALLGAAQKSAQSA
jgi:alpha-beta hydrolase superfamily lysophospholipase